MALILIDTSAWARISRPIIRDQIGEALAAASVCLTGPILLELLRSARSQKEWLELREEYGTLHHIPLTDDVVERAVEVQGFLARRGHHRAPSPVDLLSAAAAEAVGAEIWHVDADYDVIAAVTRQRVRRIDVGS